MATAALCRYATEDEPWPPPHFRQVPRSQLELVDTLFNTNAVIRSVLDHLRRYVLGGGMTAERKGKAQPGDERLFGHVRKWTHALFKIMTALIRDGFAVVRPREGDQPPAVLNYEDVDVAVCRVDGELVYCIRRARSANVIRPGTSHLSDGTTGRIVSDAEDAQLRKEARGVDRRDKAPAPFEQSFAGSASEGNQTPMSDCIVYEMNGPKASGDLTSKASALLSNDAVMQLLVHCMSVAESQKCRPVFVGELHPSASDEKDDGHAAVSGAMLNMDEDQKAFTAHMDNVSLRAEHQRLLAEQLAMSQETSRRMGDRHEALNDPVSKMPIMHVPSPNEHARYIMLPPNVRAAPAPVAQAPTNIIEWREMYEFAIGLVFGVPRDVWGHNRSAQAVNQIVMHNVYITMKDWGQILAHICEDIYAIKYAKKDAEKAGKAFADRGHISSSSSSSSSDEEDDERGDADDGDEEMAIDAIDCRVVFTFTGILDPSVVNGWLENDWITFRTWATLSARFYGVAENTFKRDSHFRERLAAMANTNNDADVDDDAAAAADAAEVEGRLEDVLKKRGGKRKEPPKTSQKYPPPPRPRTKKRATNTRPFTDTGRKAAHSSSAELK
jgi:hypothetical protein